MDIYLFDISIYKFLFLVNNEVFVSFFGKSSKNVHKSVNFSSQLCVYFVSMLWKTLHKEPINQDIHKEVEMVIQRELAARNELKICIGSDSQVKGKITEFATVILFLRVGKGGFAFVKTYKTEQKFGIKQRMIQEVSDSVQLAYELGPILDQYPVEFEIHADINTDPSFKSNVALKEAMGYILGMGYKFKAKPDAFASTYCAGKMVS